MTRPHLRAVVLGLATATALAACSGTDSPAGDDPAEPADDTSTPAVDTAPTTTASGELTIGLTYTPDVQFAPFYVAAEAGYYEDSGVDVTLRHHGASESLFGALEAGEEDLVVAGGDEMLQARSQDVPVTSVATLYQDYPVVLIVPEESDITGPADLTGRSVGIPGPFGETYFGLLVLLAEAGLTEDDVDVEHIGFTQQAALTAGHVDAVMGFVNNDVVRFAEAGTEVRHLPLTEADDVPLVGIGLGVHDDVLADQEDAVRAVTEATLRGVEDVLADPEAALELSAQHVPGLDAGSAAALATLEATAELYRTEDGTVGQVDPDAWQEMADFMESHGLLGGPVDVEDALAADLLAR